MRLTQFARKQRVTIIAGIAAFQTIIVLLYTFLTIVAGSAVLGVQFAILTPYIPVAAGLWVLAVLLWIFLIYTFFAAVTIVEPKPSIAVTINGSWLLVTVSTESLTVLGTLVAQTLGAPA